MKICIKTYAKQDQSQHVVLKLEERLPERILSPCELTCDFRVTHCGNYYLLTLDVTGTLTITCQRCLHVFQHHYSNQTKLALCATDASAESLMEHFECIVASDYQINLIDVLTDELYLFSPEKHEDLVDCDAEISHLICA